jgi:hypothetical protein
MAYGDGDSRYLPEKIKALTPSVLGLLVGHQNKNDTFLTKLSNLKVIRLLI